jgi:copper chaperone
VATTTYLVEGMTCAHCVSSVTEEVSSVVGVTAVAVDLHVGGVSRVDVTSDAPVTSDDVRAAIAEAGYAVAQA